MRMWHEQFFSIQPHAQWMCVRVDVYVLHLKSFDLLLLYIISSFHPKPKTSLKLESEASK